ELHERREEDAREPRARRADRERQQRIRGDVHAEAFRPDRVVAQRRERAPPWRAQQPPQKRDQQDGERQREPEERQHALERQPEQRRPRNPGDPEGAAGDLLLVAHYEKREDVEPERREGQIVVLDAQRRKADDEPDGEAGEPGRREDDEEG